MFHAGDTAGLVALLPVLEASESTSGLSVSEI